MLGTKIFLTEIMGYIKLGEYITTRTKGLDGPTISVSFQYYKCSTHGLLYYFILCKEYTQLIV